jgi:hypothetical protein
LPEADGHYPEFATGTGLGEHLDTVHQAPKPHIMHQAQRIFTEHVTVTQWNIEDAQGRIVGHAQTVAKRGGI